MKKIIFLIFAVVLTFGIAAFASANSDKCCDKDKAASCSCCTGDSCPMKKKDTPSGEVASCCDKCECCKAGSCPMKKKDAPKPPAGEGDKDGEHAGHTCACCSAKKHPQTVAVNDPDLR